MFTKVIQLNKKTASNLQNRLRRAAVSGSVAQFKDIHGNNYIVCHGLGTGQVVYSNHPTNVEQILSYAYTGAGLQKREQRYALSFNIICCNAAMFKDKYEAFVEYKSDPVSGKIYPTKKVKGKHVFAGDNVPVGWLTDTKVVGDYLVIKTVPPGTVGSI